MIPRLCYLRPRTCVEYADMAFSGPPFRAVVSNLVRLVVGVNLDECQHMNCNTDEMQIVPTAKYMYKATSRTLELQRLPSSRHPLQANMLPLLLPLASVLALSTGTPVPLPSLSANPITMRECYIADNTNPALIPLYASHLQTLPTTLILRNMGSAKFQHSINGTCLEAQVYNWSCDHDLSVTGPNLANAVTSITEQCNGKKASSGEALGVFGFGYYREVDTGYEYSKHLWVVTVPCTTHRVQSACSPGA
jgi:hypothetical protein